MYWNGEIQNFIAFTDCYFQQLDVKQNLARLEGKSGISSDDVFGTGRQTTSRSSYSSTPDLQDIKDGVRQGITKVAGRLSTIANGVVSSLQVRTLRFCLFLSCNT